MLFNSFGFLIFFPIVCLVYFLLPQKYRWIWLLLSSYYFYMNWKPIYALLIFGSTLITYCCGILVDKYREDRFKKRFSLVVCLLINFGILFLYKYFNFINESVYAILDNFGVKWNVPNFDVLLPVGISFYTFQAIGYSIDVYRGTIKVEKNLGIYSLFVSFFPQLVAGPIERAKNLLPQFKAKHHFNADNVVSGLTQILWGFFMKVVVADRVAIYVNAVYNNVENHSGITLLLATLLFTIQIYCDFGGYSNIAIGSARIMGFNLMENFNRPYFATSIREFWKRWHISLSTWFQDYVYIPLGGNRVCFSRHLFNLFITFLISGMWHGANWTFMAWGALHGLFLVIINIKNKYIGKVSKDTNMVVKTINIVTCFIIVSFAWIFFRANNIHDANNVIYRIFTQRGDLYIDGTTIFYSLMGISILFVKDFIDEFYRDKYELLKKRSIVFRYVLYLFLIVFIISCGVFDGGQFIYFQF